MIKNIYHGLLGVVVVVLMWMQFSPGFGAPMYERTKWIGEYFAVGSSEQFQIDRNGDVTTGDLTATGDLAFDEGTFCANFHATSSATQNRMTASTTATIEGTDGVIVFGYGACP